MTTAKTPKAPPDFTLPDPPKSQDEKMTASKHLSLTGGAHFLAQHLGNPETTIVGADLYLIPVPTTELTSMAGAVYPDLLVAFDADPALYYAQNGYVISEQGKPPDFVLEVASPSTGRRDTVEKRIRYAELRIPEYWRFDETGQYHGVRLAGDRLVDGRYEPIEIDQLPDGSLQGHSPILNVNLRWINGRLGWYDPDTGEHIATMESEREARIQAEARVQELETQLRQLRGE
ncbi:MAG: Uma2 family endonuclease [Chloroflexota bacterium]|nr:Uma2 family endonuclease [Chloroflexota bacterium]MDE2959031.1 Uma2 family endonuclease [Chloroflexota bacterium]